MLEICELYKNLEPKLIVLFGSYARGDYTDQSDIDLLIVSDKLPSDPREAFSMAFNIKNPKIMPTALNTNVFLKKLRDGSTFILEILEDGKILCGDKDFISEVIKIFIEVRKNFKREGKIWTWK